MRRPGDFLNAVEKPGDGSRRALTPALRPLVDTARTRAWCVVCACPLTLLMGEDAGLTDLCARCGEKDQQQRRTCLTPCCAAARVRGAFCGEHFATGYRCTYGLRPTCRKRAPGVWNSAGPRCDEHHRAIRRVG